MRTAYRRMEQRKLYRLPGESFEAGSASELFQKQDCVDHILGPIKGGVCFQHFQLLHMGLAYVRGSE